MMAGPVDDPIVFLDVDGTLIPFCARPAASAVVSTPAIEAADVSGNPLLDRLDPADGHCLPCSASWYGQRPG